MTHNLTTIEKPFDKARAVRLLCSCLLVAALLPVAAMAQVKTAPAAPTVSITPVSHDSVTIAGEPELYLNTPNPEVSSVVFHIPSRLCIAMDDSSCASLRLRPGRYFNGRI